MAAALAGWTKNEGLAVFGLFVLAVACERWWSSRSLRSVGVVCAGAAPVLVLIVIFKMTLAPPSYFTSEQSLAQAAASLIDGGRLRLVGQAFANELWLTGASVVGVVPFLALFAVIRRIDPAGAGRRAHRDSGDAGAARRLRSRLPGHAERSRVATADVTGSPRAPRRPHAGVGDRHRVSLDRRGRIGCQRTVAQLSGW